MIDKSLQLFWWCRYVLECLLSRVCIAWLAASVVHVSKCVCDLATLHAVPTVRMELA